MQIQKLPWAGIRVISGAASLVIDPLFHLPAKFGEPREPLFPLDEFGSVQAVLITHHHGDHFDPEAIALFYGSDIPVFMPAESIPLLPQHNLNNIRGLEIGEKAEVGGLAFTATYSVDGVGDPQVAWVVEDGERRMLHCGDTLWHGYWWKIAKIYGPFDTVFLPVNAAIIEIPGLTPSGQPICLSPELAVSAAKVLRASQLIPIHYGTIHNPPAYEETPDLHLRLLQAATTHAVNLTVLETHEMISL